MLDPSPESEREFMQGLLPEDGFTVTAVAAAEAGPSSNLLADAEAIVTRTQPVTGEMIAASPKLKLVQKYGGRPDRLDLDAAKDAGVAVAVMPLCGCIAVAELTMTLLLALSKQLIEAHRLTVSGAYRELGLEPTPIEPARPRLPVDEVAPLAGSARPDTGVDWLWRDRHRGRQAGPRL